MIHATQTVEQHKPDRMREYRLIRANGKINFYTSTHGRDKAARRWVQRDGQPVSLERWNSSLGTHVFEVNGGWEADGVVSP